MLTCCGILVLTAPDMTKVSTVAIVVQSTQAPYLIVRNMLQQVPTSHEDPEPRGARFPLQYAPTADDVRQS